MNLVILLLFVVVTSHPRMRGYNKYIKNSVSMTAQLKSDYDYDVTANPISIIAEFSNEIDSFTKDNCITVNAVVDQIISISSTQYQILLTPVTSGFLSLRLSKTIHSKSGAVLMNPPILEFNYIGATITSSRIITSTQNTVSLSVTTDKPSVLWALPLHASIKTIPSIPVILRDGQSTSTLSSTHLIVLSNLEAETSYIVYFAGKEESGTLLNIDLETTKLMIRTKSSASENLDKQSDGSICENGWGILSPSSSLELLPCSHHGYCKQEQCICVDYYSGSNCANIKEIDLDQTNSTHQLIHIQLNLYGTFTEKSKLLNYWKVSLRELIGQYLSLSPEFIQIRSWTAMKTTTTNQYLVGNHRRNADMIQDKKESDQLSVVYITVVTEHDMLLLVTKRLNEMLADNTIKTDMKQKQLSIKKAEIIRIFEQKNMDKWTCYNGIKENDETDIDCGGKCTNKCIMNQSCQTGSDCTKGLYCTKGKCIDRNWKQVAVTAIVIIGLIVVMVCVIVFGGIIYQKVKTSRTK